MNTLLETNDYDLNIFLEIVPNIMVILDSSHNILFVNYNWKNRLEYPLEHVLGRNFLEYVFGEDKYLTERFIKKVQHERKSPVLINRLLNQKHKKRWFSWHAQREENGQIYLVGEDITKQKKLEEGLYKKANVDSLTNLLNRDTFSASLKRFVARGKRYNQYFALAFIDLNKFKAINDTLGHAAGDIVLKKAGERLHAALREGDLAGRLGGDEFVAILAGKSKEENYQPIIDRIISTIQQPLEISENKLIPEISIGIASFPLDGSDVKTLLQKADEAMYVAKQKSRINESSI